MERLTHKNEATAAYIAGPDSIQCTADGYTGQAVERLAVFEELYENIAAEQAEITQKLERLRSEGKTKTYQFRELMGQKLSNSYCLRLFASYGL